MAQRAVPGQTSAMNPTNGVDGMDGVEETGSMHGKGGSRAQGAEGRRGVADAYLERIGAARPARADAAALRELQLRHLMAVPFENLSVHLGEDIVLEEEKLLDKIVTARRGGFCYELNGAFAALLRELGFRVTLLQARAFGDGGRLGIPYDHVALRVETDDGTGPWLADVGFGDHALHPLALDDRTEQDDPCGVFRFRGRRRGTWICCAAGPGSSASTCGHGCSRTSGPVPGTTGHRRIPTSRSPSSVHGAPRRGV